MSAVYPAVIRLLEADPDLAEQLPAEPRRQATQHIQVRTLRVPTGAWEPPEIPAGAVGLLMLSGLIVRRVSLGRSGSTELLGPSDVIRPGRQGLESVLWPAPSDWHVLQEAQLAVLDRRATALTGRWPELTAALCTRLVRRCRSQAYLMAAQHFTRVSDRLLASLWHMADRWGRVTVRGTVVPFRLTHEMLGQIIGARRPTTTQAVSALEHDGLLMRDERRHFVLLGDPPHWELPPADGHRAGGVIAQVAGY